jgi:catechol 2,3-dioxygenase-like lactoylglutathione lyase family enzyme
MIRGVHHTAVSTPNLERALAFYRDLLGFEVLSEFAWPVGTEVADRITGLKGSSAKAAMLRAGNIMLELFQYETPVPKPGHPVRPVCDHGITHVCLDVTDLDTEYEDRASGDPEFGEPHRSRARLAKAGPSLVGRASPYGFPVCEGPLGPRGGPTNRAPSRRGANGSPVQRRVRRGGIIQSL